MHTWLSIQQQTKGTSPLPNFWNSFLIQLLPVWYSAPHVPAILIPHTFLPSQLSETTVICLIFPLPALWAGKCLQEKIQLIMRLPHLFSFSQGSHSCATCSVPEKSFHILCPISLLFILGGLVQSQSLQKQKSQYLTFHF